VPQLVVTAAAADCTCGSSGALAFSVTCGCGEVRQWDRTLLAGQKKGIKECEFYVLCCKDVHFGMKLYSDQRNAQGFN
jgi:hypothetical protein